MQREKKNVLSQAKLWVFYCIALCIIPFLFFVSLEAVLRSFNYGYSTRYLIPCEYKDCQFLRDNPDFTRRFFSDQLAKSDLPVIVPDTKAPDTYRIFVLGASAAAGYPIPDFSFSRILEEMLKEKFPQVHFEVINTSNVAINSHIVLEIIKELARYQPDMFIVYLGNNEVVGPYGPGTVLKPFAFDLRLIRAGIYMNSTKIGQLLKSVMHILIKKDTASLQEWGGMAMFVEKRVPASDPRLQKTYSFFEKNLNDILHTAQRAGAITIVSTVVSNVKDLAPFASMHGPDFREEWNGFYEEGIDFEFQGKFDQAVEQYLLALHIDDQFAELHFRLARCYQALAKFDLAREQYLKARDLDALRFRADTQINDIIRKTASNRKGEKIFFVDGAKYLEDQSPFGVPGKEYFYEHVHFNFDGNYLLAKKIFEQMRGSLPERIVKGKKREKPVLSKDECAARLGWTSYEELVGVSALLSSLVNKPPFTAIVNYKEMVEGLEQRQKILMSNFKENGVSRLIDEQMRSFERNPQDPWRHYHLGRILLQANRPQEALKFLRFAVGKMPSLKDAKRLLNLAEDRLQKESKKELR